MSKSKDFSMVLNNGEDLDMGAICGCTTQKMSECEANCIRYYNCYNIAFANDILVAYECDEEYEV